MNYGRTIVLVVGLLCAGGTGSAAELKVMLTGSMAAPLREIAESFARKNGHTVDVTVGITTTVSATLQAGEKADVVEVTSVGMDQLQRENLIRGDSRVEIARALIGVAVRAGAAVPDISTPEALKRALGQARSIAYVNPRFAGQVGVNLMAFLGRLGASDEVTKKAVLAFTGEEAVQKVAKGEADMVLAFVSEILPVKGVKWLGPLPAALQVPTNYSAAIGAGSANPDLARALLQAIGSADGQRLIRDAGLEPVPSGPYPH
jgi:molybdate transport system substrate-binding protein